MCTRARTFGTYRQATVDMKRCTDRISRPFIRVRPPPPPPPAPWPATELLLINCTLRWPDPPTKRSRRRANRQRRIKRFSDEIPPRVGFGVALCRGGGPRTRVYRSRCNIMMDVNTQLPENSRYFTDRL